MNILLVSECSKHALPNTRRVLDQFAERTGQRTWLTPITEAGLRTLHDMLRRSARRNTAVACHWIKGGEIELLWIVGKRQRFNRAGLVPTNRSRVTAPLGDGDNRLRHTQSIAVMAAIAGLFHDFGKATKHFQHKLDPNRKTTRESDPVRHEWVSLMVFAGFVAERSDTDWLTALGAVSPGDSTAWITGAKAFTKGRDRSPLYPLKDKPVALAVAWLILSHHRMPFERHGCAGAENKAQDDNVELWQRRLNHRWNAFRSQAFDDWANWLQFPGGLPDHSATWRTTAKRFAAHAARCQGLTETDWWAQPLALHLGRCALMLADHRYSGSETTPAWQDPDYAVWANSRATETGRGHHQRLDEHCIGVSRMAYLLARQLPTLRSLLPCLSEVRPLRKPAKGAFAWQNRAYALARETAPHAAQHGGFFINLASTGTGKTLANARMAYGLSNDATGCRFNVLLGLRTLTLQTGDALRERIGLSDADLAVLVGGSAQQSWHAAQSQTANQGPANDGRESDTPFFAEHEFVRYDGELDQSRFGEWIKGRDQRHGNNTLHRLLSAPIVVATLDHLMPATESQRGGGQIAPLLRLLSSDTVLDEPDDFDLSDQHALTRFVYMIGLCGGRVILSSATLPPALIEALYAAYASGRTEYNTATLDRPLPPVCGWVDEFGSYSGCPEDATAFASQHTRFVGKRLKRLARVTPKRLATLAAPDTQQDWPGAVASTLHEHITTLATAHRQTHPDTGHTVSVGVVRFANIDPMIQVAKILLAESPPEDTDWQVCIYHARHPFARRMRIEHTLDTLLRRHDPSAIWQHADVKRSMDNAHKHQVFIVLASPVVEVGRDLDFDWAVLEPSSLRSLVQLAGRVQRHRDGGVGETPNIALLNTNIRALQGKRPAYSEPGYENTTHPLSSHTLENILTAEQYQHPNAAGRIAERVPLSPADNLADLEHHATREALLGTEAATWPARLWWQESVQWTHQLQHQRPFRDGQPTDNYALIAEDPTDEAVFHLIDDESVPMERQLERAEFDPADGIHRWPDLPDATLLTDLADGHDDLERACRRFMQVSLTRQSETAIPDRWQYDQWLGFYK